MSMLGGYPVGAKMISGLLEQKKNRQGTSQPDALLLRQRRARLPHRNCGAFMLHSTALGVILLVSQILSSLLIGTFLGLFTRFLPK